MSNSYTSMSYEAIDATVAALPRKYEMALNKSDMRALLNVLTTAYNVGNLSDENASFVQEFVTDIAQSVGIEFI